MRHAARARHSIRRLAGSYSGSSALAIEPHKWDSFGAQTGYDTDTTVAFHVDHGSHSLCGTNTFPGDYPKRAQWDKRG